MLRSSQNTPWLGEGQVEINGCWIIRIPFLCLMKESLFKSVWVFPPVWKLFNAFLVRYSSFSFCFLMSKECLYALFWNHFRGSLGRIQTTDLGRSYFPKHECYEGSWRDSKNGWFHTSSEKRGGNSIQCPKKVTVTSHPFTSDYVWWWSLHFLFNLDTRSINHLLKWCHDTPNCLPRHDWSW